MHNFQARVYQGYHLHCRFFTEVVGRLFLIKKLYLYSIDVGASMQNFHADRRTKGCASPQFLLGPLHFIRLQLGWNVRTKHGVSYWQVLQAVLNCLFD